MKNLLKLLMLLFASVMVSCSEDAPVEATKFTVSFETNGGSVIPSVSVEEGAKVAEPTAPILVDGEFMGWFTDETYAVAWNFASDVVNSDITLYAKWNISYRVSFETNGGENAPSDIIDIQSGSTIDEPQEPTKENFIFVGWFKEEALSTMWDFAVDVVASNTTLYAKWIAQDTKFTYQFVYGNGTEDAEAVEVNAGTKISEPAEPMWDGYEFKGWSATNQVDDIWDFDTAITESVTLTAQWEKLYNVAFVDEVNGRTFEPVVVKNGERVTEPKQIYFDDQRTWGWYTDADYTEEYDFKNKTYSADLTLYVKWANCITVTYINEGEEYNLCFLFEGDMVYEVYEPTSEEHPDWRFMGWYTESGEAWNYDEPVLGDLTLYAKYEDKPIEVSVELSWGSSYYDYELDRNYRVYIENHNIPDEYFNVFSGSKIPEQYIPGIPTSYTHTFVGWKIGYDKPWDFATDIIPGSSDYSYICAVWETKDGGYEADLYSCLPDEDRYDNGYYTDASLANYKAAREEALRLIRETTMTQADVDEQLNLIGKAIEDLKLRDFGSTAGFDHYYHSGIIYDEEDNMTFVLRDKDYGSNYTFGGEAVDSEGNASNAEILFDVVSGDEYLEIQKSSFYDIAAGGSGETNVSVKIKGTGSGTLKFSTANNYSETKKFTVISLEDATDLFYEKYNAFIEKTEYVPSDYKELNMIADLGSAIYWDDHYEYQDKLYDLYDLIPEEIIIEKRGGKYILVVEDEGEIDMTYKSDGSFPYGSYSFTIEIDEEKTTFVLKEDGNCTMSFEEEGEDIETEYCKFTIHSSSTSTKKVIWMTNVGEDNDDVIQSQPVPAVASANVGRRSFLFAK